MQTSSNWIVCDGCGVEASPEHMAERVRRLELATRFRPVHMSVLFVARAPIAGLENDFYGPPESLRFFDPFMNALEISNGKGLARPADVQTGNKAEKLEEFQRRGYYLSFLAECPIAGRGPENTDLVLNLGPTLLRRIRFNYKPKHIALLGAGLRGVREILETALPTSAGIIELPDPGEESAAGQFRDALTGLSRRENPGSGYDRLQVTQP